MYCILYSLFRKKEDKKEFAFCNIYLHNAGVGFTGNLAKILAILTLNVGFAKFFVCPYLGLPPFSERARFSLSLRIHPG